jgi:hypothetical protein
MMLSLDMSGCDISFSVVQHALSVHVGFSIGMPGWSFSASGGYQRMFNRGVTGDLAYTGTFTFCSAYLAAWDDFAFQPTFTPNFYAAVAGLGSTVSWLDFVEAFGGCLSVGGQILVSFLSALGGVLLCSV